MWKSLEMCLESGSSPVDWCEVNYTHTPLIAEFINTISNVLFFILPPILIHLSKEYAKSVNPAINVLWIMMIIVGMSSVYFHATLSLLGQLLDEIAILWVIIAAFVSFLPSRYFPKKFNRSRVTFASYAGVFTLLLTGLLVIYPKVNAFVLMSLALPALTYMLFQLKRLKCPRVYRLGIKTVCVWFLAACCWVLDRFFCDTWLSINFPYFHGLWHIFICIAGSSALITFAFIHVFEERPEQKPLLKYWPIDSCELGLAYVVVKHPKRKLSNEAI